MLAINGRDQPLSASWLHRICFVVGDRALALEDSMNEVVVLQDVAPLVQCVRLYDIFQLSCWACCSFLGKCSYIHVKRRVSSSLVEGNQESERGMPLTVFREVPRRVMALFRVGPQGKPGVPLVEIEENQEVADEMADYGRVENLSQAF